MGRKPKEVELENKSNGNSDFIKKLNTKFGKPIAKMLTESDNANIKEFISTGSTVLDIFVSNRCDGGFPVGRLSTIDGEEQTGKSLLAAHAVADTLKRGGTVIYIDNEHAVDMNFFRRIGVDTEKMIYVDGLDYMEQIFELIEKSAMEFRNDHLEDLFTIVWDSVASTPTKAEVAGDFEAKFMGEAAKVLSQSIKKLLRTLDRYKVCLIAVNQLRNRIARPGQRVYGDMLIATGGRAIPFYSTVQIRLRKSGYIKDESDNIMGVFVNAKVLKTRLGPPFRSCDLNVYFSHGVDDSDSWLEIMKKHGIIEVKGSWFLSEELFADKKFQTMEWKKALKDNDFRMKAKELLCKNLIIDYDKVDIGKMVIDNIDSESYSEIKSLSEQIEGNENEEGITGKTL